MNYTKVLLAVCPHGKTAIIQGFAEAMPDVIRIAKLDTDQKIGVFIGQCAEESAGFQTTTEYASGAEYESRRDLGNTQKGDGRKYKGRGLIQVTGRFNYAKAGEALATDLTVHPDLAAQFPLAALISAWFWDMRHLNAAFGPGATSQSIIRGTTYHINGGLNGLNTRTLYIERAWRALKDPNLALKATAASNQIKAVTQSGASVALSAGAVAGATIPHSDPGMVAASALGAAAGYLALKAFKNLAAAATALKAAKTE